MQESTPKFLNVEVVSGQKVVSVTVDGTTVSPSNESTECTPILLDHCSYFLRGLTATKQPCVLLRLPLIVCYAVVTRYCEGEHIPGVAVNFVLFFVE